MTIELSGTKELIFDTFVEMTSTLGYENVSMREIAQKVGIQVASIYNHFNTKADILEYAYDYHSQRQYENREPIENMKKLIETAGAEEILQSFVYTYESDDQKKYFRMVRISKIVYMRLFQDRLANAKFADGNSNNTEYIIEILRHGVEIGRVDPKFDVVIFAELLIGAIQVMEIKAFSNDNNIGGQSEKGGRIMTMLSRLLDTALK